MDPSLEAFFDDDRRRLLFSTTPWELPVFEPVEESTQRLDSDSDDDRFAPGDVHDLLQTGTNPRDLQAYLTKAARAAQEDVVEMLLSVGVPVSLTAVKAAIAKESIPMLSLFLKHGWDINEEEQWCIPSLLSYVRFEVLQTSLTSNLRDALVMRYPPTSPSPL